MGNNFHTWLASNLTSSTSHSFIHLLPAGQHQEWPITNFSRHRQLKTWCKRTYGGGETEFQGFFQRDLRKEKLRYPQKSQKSKPKSTARCFLDLSIILLKFYLSKTGGEMIQMTCGYFFSILMGGSCNHQLERESRKATPERFLQHCQQIGWPFEVQNSFVENLTRLDPWNLKITQIEMEHHLNPKNPPVPGSKC